MEESEKIKMMAEAVQIARKILSGEIDTNLGCAKLGEINRDLDWPTELSAFGLLAHELHIPEQDEHLFRINVNTHSDLC